MSANRLFLVCQHCQEPEHALLLAERDDSVTQYERANLRRADEWFASHARCGEGSDHYKLAYGRPQDWDLATKASKAASAVRLALANGGGE